MPAPPDRIRAQVEGLRRNLLDLTLRNRMLNYKPSKRLSIEIQGMESAQTLKLLVTDEKAVSFLGIPDTPKKKQGALNFEEEDPYKLAEYRKAAEEEFDSFIDSPELVAAPKPVTKCNVAELESVLQQKLRTMEREARLANDELGINTLFLTLGTLTWSEPGQPECKAPLIFIPVKLERLRSGAMRLRHDGNDVGGNLPLKAKLAEANFRLPEFDDDQPLGVYFDEVQETVKSKPDWEVNRDEIFLSFFNYEKYSMYVDLGGENWPEGDKPWQNPDIAAMLGDGYTSPESTIGDDTQIDPFRPVQNTREVFDADSSQALAMIRAATGLSIVIEGPPGTGKSQTITNIIAEAVGSGKTVLFVSAKRAALEVVKRNLTRADLAPMCLDLHDRLSNRREFYEEIKRTVNKAISAKSEEQKVQRLTELRDLLNTLAESVNEEITPYGTAPFGAMTRLAQLPPEESEDRAARIDFGLLRGQNAGQIEQALSLVQSVERHLESMGSPSDHPFCGCEIDYLDPALRLDLEEDLRDAIVADEQSRAAIAEAAQALSIDPPITLNQVKVLHRCLEQALAAPPHQGISVAKADWDANRSLVAEIIETLHEIQAIRQARAQEVSPQIWAANLNGIAQVFDRHAGQWFNFIFGEFKTANRELETFLLPSAPSLPAERVKLLLDVIRVQTAEAKVIAVGPKAKNLFGVQWKELDSDPRLLADLSKWVYHLFDQISSGELPGQFLRLFTGEYSDGTLKLKTSAAEEAASKAKVAYRKVSDLLKFSDQKLDDEPFESRRNRLEVWSQSMARLSAYISYTELRRKLVSTGLEPVAVVADHWKPARQKLAQILVRSFYSGVVREAMQNRPALRTFDRPSHEAAIDEFRSLDDFKLVYNRFLVRSSHQSRLPSFSPSTAGNLKTLMVQCQLQRKHRPIRWIMGEAGEAIQRIKPVFMMSPLSVAIHLPPELPKFDLVIFDEASQIKPEDALSAIARAKQCVVVGDTRQMPPTNFFTNLAGQDDEIEEGEATAGSGETKKLESVLSLMSAVTGGKVRRPDLRWHYRSIHPSLIQPSNEMFYDGRLVVFPSPGAEFEGKQIGIVFTHLKDATYESGQTKRVNRLEAKTVADRVLELIEASVAESILVAAINKPQADLIYEELVKLEAVNPEPFQRYRERNPHEPLDIKNLENVQGDERDVVLISITYGKDAAGVLRQQFGPLLLDGGERRLNVLITRARNRCEVFSSVLADDIRAESGQAGILALKSFLRFAERGELLTSFHSESAEVSPFIQEVSEALEEAGYKTQPMIGSEGFRIDLGVFDPEDPDSFLLGIECDGPTYNAARSARDRDKLRQRVLERRGWKLYRIWSHDWWQDLESEKARLLQAIQNAKESPVPEEPNEEQKVEVVESDQPILKPPQTRPYAQATAQSFDNFGPKLDAYAVEVIQTESPISAELLRMRLKAALGITRESASAKANLDASLRKCKQFAIPGNAFASEPDKPHFPRDWSGRPTAEKKLDLVPDVELFSALRAVVSTSYGIDSSSAVKAAYSLLGFKKCSEQALERGLKIVEESVLEGRMSRNSDQELAVP